MELIVQARMLVGTPFVHQGRSRHGVDCIGLLKLSASNAGLDLEAASGLADRAIYQRAPSRLLLDRTQLACTRVKTPEPGLLVLFRFPHISVPQHFGVLTERKTLVHADAKQLRVVEHNYSGMWLRLTHSFWRLPGVRYG